MQRSCHFFITTFQEMIKASSAPYNLSTSCLNFCRVLFTDNAFISWLQMTNQAKVDVCLVKLMKNLQSWSNIKNFQKKKKNGIKSPWKILPGNGWKIDGFAEFVIVCVYLNWCKTHAVNCLRLGVTFS